jgi:hypothetical protein
MFAPSVSPFNGREGSVAGVLVGRLLPSLLVRRRGSSGGEIPT